MYKVFVDTNILFEHALQRQNSKQCTDLLKLAEDGMIRCYAVSASFYTLAYFLQKEVNGKQILQGYLSLLETIPTDQETLSIALSSSFIDLEDGFQYFTALKRCNYFLTFNVRDFRQHLVPQLPCMTPQEFLMKI